MKYIFVVFLIAFIAEVSFAQHLLIGPKAGFQMSRAYADDPHFYDDFHSRFLPAYQAGVVANFKVTNIFSLETEVLYNQTGKRMVGDDNYSFQNERYHNISIPALLRASYTAGMNQFYINIGPGISYWLGGRGKLKIPELQDAGVKVLPYDIAFGEIPLEGDAFYVSKPNRLLFSLEAGIGAILPVHQNFLMLDLRYSWGHTDLAKHDSQYMYFLNYDGRIHHSTEVISFSVAYLFELDFLEMLKGKSTDKKKR